MAKYMVSWNLKAAKQNLKALNDRFSEIWLIHNGQKLKTSNHSKKGTWKYAWRME